MTDLSGFYCSCCGQWHDELPLDIGYEMPDLVYSIAEADRSERVEQNADFCVVDNQYYFVRGIIELPICETDETFCWGVWVSLSERNFKQMISLVDTTGRESEPPYFGWLCNRIPYYVESTEMLKTRVHTQPVGMRPQIELEPTNHPLAIEQREGITMVRVQTIIEQALHG